MAQNLAQKLIERHLAGGDMEPGGLVALEIDQTLTQDATGTLVMLALEAMGLDRARAGLCVQYVDHNLIQEDSRNPDDHLFLMSAAARFGLHYSRPGNGVSHPLHMMHFGVPGATLLGSDSHTPAAGGLGMLAMGAGGLDVALAIAGQPYHMRMPEIWGVRLTGALPDWVSAKDVILEMLRRHGVEGGKGRVVEYYGPGLACLSAMDRHVIANMGTELGATATVFPSDDAVRTFLEDHRRGSDFVALEADEGAGYDVDEEIDLGELEPLIALPSSPGKVVPVRKVAGQAIYQAYIGSSANPGFRDFAVPALMARACGRAVPAHVSLDINPSSRDVLDALLRAGLLGDLLSAGARLHQAGCNGCIGMGQAPATGRNSLRTVPRNFPGRSGTREDAVFLCSPETAMASALEGKIVDPRDIGLDYPRVERPTFGVATVDLMRPPLPYHEAREVELVKGPNITSMPELDALADTLDLAVILTLGDDISTDEILPAGAEVLPYRSNIEAISRYAFYQVDEGYSARARETREDGGHAVVAGRNYGQGSSREHAALAPRFLGLRAVLAVSIARIHRQNLINFGVVPLTIDQREAESIAVDDRISISGLRAAVEGADEIDVQVANGDGKRTVTAHLDLKPRERDVLAEGGLTNWCRRHLQL